MKYFFSRHTISYIVVVLICSNALMYTYNYGILPIMTGISYFFLFLLSLISFVYYKSSLSSNNRRSVFSRAVQIRRSNNIKIFTLWHCLFFLSILLSFIYSDIDENSVRFVKSHVVIMALIVSLIFLFQTKKDQNAIRLAVTTVVLLSVCCNIIDFIINDPTVFSKVDGRAAGLYINPNISSQMIVAGMVISISALPKRLRLAFCLFAAIGVLLTFSRGGIIGWCVATYLLIIQDYLKINRIILISSLTLLIIVFFALQLGYIKVGNQINLSQNAVSRLQFQQDASAFERIELISIGLKEFSESPFLGGDVGSKTLEGAGANPHNQYILLLVQQGILGFMLFITLLFLIWKRGHRTAKLLVTILALFSIFSHNILGTPAWWFFITISLLIEEERHI